jgi:hypothetical protein
MSIERNDARRAAEEAQIKQQLDARKVEDAHLRGGQRAEASAESVDRFKAALQKQADPRAPQGRSQQGQAPEQARTGPDPGALRFAQRNERGGGDQTRAVQREAAEAHAEETGASQQAAAQGLGEREVRRKQEHGDSGSSGSDASSDIAGMWQAQMALRSDGGMPTQAPQAPVNTQQFADLIQKHVRQMAASDEALKGSDGQVLLRMSDATLPGTDLLLSRTATGWTLRADSRSRDSFDAIRRAAPELAKRFADSDLGELTIEPHFHG